MHRRRARNGRHRRHRGRCRRLRRSFRRPVPLSGRGSGARGREHRRPARPERRRQLGAEPGLPCDEQRGAGQLRGLLQARRRSGTAVRRHRRRRRHAAFPDRRGHRHELRARRPDRRDEQSPRPAPGERVGARHVRDPDLGTGAERDELSGALRRFCRDRERRRRGRRDAVHRHGTRQRHDVSVRRRRGERARLSRRRHGSRQHPGPQRERNRRRRQHHARRRGLAEPSVRRAHGDGGADNATSRLAGRRLLRGDGRLRRGVGAAGDHSAGLPRPRSEHPCGRASAGACLLRARRARRGVSAGSRGAQAPRARGAVAGRRRRATLPRSGAGARDGRGRARAARAAAPPAPAPRHLLRGARAARVRGRRRPGARVDVQPALDVRAQGRLRLPRARRLRRLLRRGPRYVDRARGRLPGSGLARGGTRDRLFQRRRCRHHGGGRARPGGAAEARSCARVREFRAPARLRPTLGALCRRGRRRHLVRAAHRAAGRTRGAQRPGAGGPDRDALAVSILAAANGRGARGRRDVRA